MVGSGTLLRATTAGVDGRFLQNCGAAVPLNMDLSARGALCAPHLYTMLPVYLSASCVPVLVCGSDQFGIFDAAAGSTLTRLTFTHNAFVSA